MFGNTTIPLATNILGFVRSSLRDVVQRVAIGGSPIQLLQKRPTRNRA